MTRRHALVQLLRLGPLTRAEIAEITGWPAVAVKSALSAMCEQGLIVRRVRRRCSLFEVVR